MKLKESVNKLIKSEYFTNISVQLTGTLIAQLVPIAISPILARLYEQDAFAVLAVFMAVVGVLSVPNAGRYNIAIVKPKSHNEAERLYQLSVLLSIVYNILLLIVVIIGYSFFNKHYKLDELWFLVPFFVFLFGVYNSGLFYSIREKKFKKNIKAKISQTIVNSIAAIIIYFSFNLFGLVVARFLGLLVSTLLLFRIFKFKLNYQKLKKTALEYIDYPKLTIIPTLMNIFSLQALILYARPHYSDQSLGFLGLASMILVAPTALIGISYRDVFYQKITQLYNSREFLKARQFFLFSALGLFVIAVILSVVLFFFGEFLFSFIYGDQWTESGKYASILVFATAIKLIVSPLSVVLNTTEKLKWLSIWQVNYFITLNTVFYISVVKMKINIEDVFIIYVIHEIVMYSVYFLLQYFSLKK